MSHRSMATNSVPPRLALSTIASTSFESIDLDELAIGKFLSRNAGLLLDSGIRIRFWIISFLMFIMGVLHLITLIKNISIRNCWLVERNKSGYLNPNLEILVPLFALVNSSLVLCSIIMMNRDNGRYLSRPTMITQMISYNALCYCAATRVWRTLSAIPLVPVQLTPHGTSLLSNGVPPFLFNTLVILLYISFPVATLPLTLKMTREADQLGKKVFELVPELKLLIAQEQETPGAGLPRLIVEEVKHKLDLIDEILIDVNSRWRISCGVYLFYCLGLFALFIYASARLYSTLTVQLQLLTQARRRFARMASVGVIPSEDDLPHATATESGRASTTYRNLVTSIKRLKAAIWTQGQDQSECMKFWDCLDASSENAELERKAKMSSRYRTAVLWQSFCSSLIFLAFVVLTSCLAFDAFGVPHRTSATQVAIITFEWTGWAWSVPGSVLALVTCGVALLPHSASEAAANLPSTTSTRKQSAKDYRLQPKLSRTSTESDVVNLRPYGFFPTEMQETSTAKTTSEFKTLSSKIWSKLSTYAGNSSALPVFQRERKVSCLSLSEEEKTSEHAVNEISPAHGIEIHTETARGMPCISRTPPFAPGHVILPMGKIRSDLNIIKSLRHHPGPDP